MLGAVSLVGRGLLLLCGAVILGLSVALAKHQHSGSVPSETSFSIFAALFGLVVSTVGIAAIWLDSIPQLVMLVLDSVASIFYIVAASALTVAMKDISSCTNSSEPAPSERWVNKITGGGCSYGHVNLDCLWNFDGLQSRRDITPSRCQRARADYFFEYVAFAFGVAIALVGWLSHKRSGPRPSAA